MILGLNDFDFTSSHSTSFYCHQPLLKYLQPSDIPDQTILTCTARLGNMADQSVQSLPIADMVRRLGIHASRQPRGNPEHEHPNWRSYTFVKVFVRNLPDNVTTLEVYFNLIRFGNISQITLHDTRGGSRATTAEVTFKPPPSRPPWKYPGIPFERDRRTGGPATTIHARLDYKQPKNFTLKNHASHVVYNEETTILAHSLHFGVLKNEREMDVMHTVQSTPESQVRLVLNLKRSEIEIYFPVLLGSSNKPRVRSYRFHVALDEMFRIFRSFNDDESTTFVLNVQNAPWYSRRLEDKISRSHDSEAKRWKEDDMWFRQTDIVDHKEDFHAIDQTPVALRKNMNTINISRWTTFALNIPKSQESDGVCKVFADALKDFSNRVLDASDFKVNRQPQNIEARYWHLLDGPQPASSGLVLDTNAWALSFEVRYQLEVCVSHGWLNEYEIDESFLRILSEMSEHKAKQLLVQVAAYAQRIFDPTDIFNDIKYHKPMKAIQIPGNCAEVYHATVTATGLLLDTPSVEISNRIIRKYRNHGNRFLRVRFEDDNYRGQTKLYASSNNKMILVFDRVRRTLRNGIKVAGRKYDFLAWGNSQLRDHGCYFFAAVDGGPSASSIRAEMGAFDNEKIVAKRAARMGQCFSTTQPIHLRINPVTKETTIPDIIRGRYTFSDGVGKISPLTAQMVHANLKLSGEVPSCFQFRLGGCKGILAVDPTLTGVKVEVRASQFKFDSSSQELEIIRQSEFWQPFLNRQLILVLSALGVKDEVFIGMQKATMEALDSAMRDENAALKALRNNIDPNRMTLAICDLISHSFQRVQEPFTMSLLHLWRAWSLKYLKEKAKIPIPQGAFVLGTIDETGLLRGHFDSLQTHADASREEKEKALPEIFLQITDPQSGKLKIIEGVCILARNPSLHKGDIRVVKAVNVPELHHLRDCVVVPQTGDRDLPSMCSGGDLDGDDYVVAWDEKLIPPIWNAEPFHYDPPAPKRAGGEFSISLMIDFFYDYMQNDYLGRIAHAHLGAADFLMNGIESEECLELLHLHSMAVDYPKTGVPANLPRRLERTEWPHFMEKRGKSYRSSKVLGRLFDAVKRVDFEPRYEDPFDSRILNSMTPSDGIKQQAAFLKHEYDLALRRIMVQHKIRTEFEVWSTFVIDHSKASRDYKFHEEIGQLSRALKEQFYHAVVEVAGGNTFDYLRGFAVAAYQLTALEFRLVSAERAKIPEGGVKPEIPFISFPWILTDVLGKIASSVTVQPSAPAVSDATKVSMAQETQGEHASTPSDVSGRSVSEGSENSDMQPVLDEPSGTTSEGEVDAAEETGKYSDKVSVFGKPSPFDGLDPFSTQSKQTSPTIGQGAFQAVVRIPRPRMTEPSTSDDSPVAGPQQSLNLGSEVESLGDDISSILPSGTEKDPATMTQAEKEAAGFADDDDDL